MVGFGFRWLGVVAAFLAIATVASDAAAQVPDERLEYHRAGTPKAPHDKSEQRLRDEAEEFARREAACEGGAAAACGALGEAYELGIGSGQNRPIAAILYSEACDAGDVQSCYRLGRVTRAANRPTAKAEAYAIWDRACQIGSLDACALAASALSTGAGVEQDEVGAAQWMRDTCESGGAKACVYLAGTIRRDDPDRARRGEIIELLRRGCEGGDVVGCDDLLAEERYAQGYAIPARSDILERACGLDGAFSCGELGDRAFRGDDGPADRDEALRYYDRACYIEPMSCELAQDLRAEPVEIAACQSDDNQACARLAEIYGKNDTVLFNPDLSQQFYEYACYVRVTEVCGKAAQLVLDDRPYLTSQNAMQALAYLERGCAADHMDACWLLTEELELGEITPPDRQRYHALLLRMCTVNWGRSCEELEANAEEDLSIPLTQASVRYLPPVEEGDTDWIEPFLTEEEREAERTQCALSEIVFRGKLYRDIVCRPREMVIGGKAVRPGDAPWQALIWRPRVGFGRALTPQQRVLCGGSLIRRGWILTAAHCLTDEGRSITRGGYRVRLGVHNARADEGVSYPITRVYRHPSYNGTTYAFDIALVRYDERSGRRSSTVHPIASISTDRVPLDQRRIRQGQPVFVYGWGWTDEVNSTSSAQLLGAKLLLRSPAYCNSITGSRGSTLNAALCAAGPNGENACYGDSGGPLITYNDADRRPRVIGVVSSGRACGQEEEASRYARIAAARGWIDSVLRSNP